MDEHRTTERTNENWRSDRHKPSKKIKRFIIGFGSLFILALIAYTTILYGGKLIVDEEKMTLSGPTTIETVDGEELWSLYDEYRIPVKLDEIPDHVIHAFISIEDRRFFEHSGVDFISIMRAIYRDIVARSKVEGASTITQQLAKNLFLSNEKTWLRKTKEVMVSLYLERELTKDNILELYLNVIYFGKGQYGIEAASQKFFSKSVGDLTLEEGALLAAIVKAPNSYSPIDYPEKALERRNLVLESMYQTDFITEEEKNEAIAQPLNLNVSMREFKPDVQAYIDLVLKEANEKHQLSLEQLQKNEYKLIVTMNPTIQQIAYEQFQYDQYFPGNNMSDIQGAFVMMDEATGGIVAAIGGRDYEFGQLNRVVVNRQPGSTMKPIAVYAPALMQKELHPYSLIPDQLLEWDEGTFRNADGVYEGAVSVYKALVQSKNSPSVWLLDDIGIDYAKDYLQAMDIALEDEGLSIALGGLTDGITPINLIESYRTFVHDGQFIPSYTIQEIQDEEGETIFLQQTSNKQIFSKQVSWTMIEILKGVVEEGTGTAGNYAKELAGKTGTTEHPIAVGYTKDAWFVGLTPEYVTALWIGYDKSTEENYLTGNSSYPTKLTKQILTLVDEQLTLKETFTQPEDVESVMHPIELPDKIHVTGTKELGGLSIVKGKLSWDASEDERIVYRIYKVKDGIDELIGEVTGESEYVIENIKFFKKEYFYVVPFDPLTETEGKQSNIISL